MKMLIKEGKIIKEQNLVQFKESTDEISLKFKDSLNRVLDFLSGYDVKKYDGNTSLDIYYLYYFKDNPEDLKEVIDNILDNSDINFINNSNIILSLYKISDSTIFWDVISNDIIVLGKDNLKALLYELEKLRWVKHSVKFNDKEFEQKYINAAASDVYKKVLKM